MGLTTASAALRFSRSSARHLMRQLHKRVGEQRLAVTECRNRAEGMSVSDTVRGGPVGKAEQPPSPPCFVEVASEKDVTQNFIEDGLLSGIAVAVSDALDVQEFYTSSRLHTPMAHDAACKEFPLITWLRLHGAQFVGKLRCCTPFALSEGIVFGPEKPASIAIAEHACDYIISCSLNGPPSVLCAVHHDMVGFKPTSQTFGTFTERFQLAVPSMTVGLSARRLDDLMYLWQVYTASIDSEAYFETKIAKRAQSKTFSTAGSTSASSPPSTLTRNDASSSEATAGNPTGEHSKARASGDALSLPVLSTTAGPCGGDPRNQQASDPPTRLVQLISSWWSGKVVPNVKHPDDVPSYSNPDILDHSPYNYTVRSRRSHMADIDVGWCDYNTKEAMTEDFNQPSRPGFLRRLFTGAQTYEAPKVELAVGYPAEWIDQYCTDQYASSAEFHQRITDAVSVHSALHYNQKLEIVPLAFDFSIEEVMEAVRVISHYELAKAFERHLEPTTVPFQADEGSKSVGVHSQGGADGNSSHSFPVPSPEKAPQLPVVPGVEPSARGGGSDSVTNRLNLFMNLPGALENLPASLVDSVQAGQKLSIRDYHRALRVRDDVVRSTEEQFIDVDCFITPLLCDPYTSGDMRSVRLMLPFQLAGNPILSVQVDPQTPVAMIGELGRDAALMEDAFCFLQFVRGTSPLSWPEKMAEESPVEALGAGKGGPAGARETVPYSGPAGPTVLTT
ncbi:hypothetical protein, conserved [Leishmania tarentolae]|uniref:Amidase domain-containing protein n=1 Tax=Leishmania tarentolae TaxID=5689 RepID=A0A640KJL8_LEITA|nr:hypothetical protein, conserved [Leishmania tarentolae]